MDLVELQQLAEWVDEHVRSPDVIQRYQTLLDILRANGQGGQQQSIETQKSELLAAVSAVPIDLLSMQQQDLLERLNIAPFVGARAVDWIEDVLFRTNLDIATAQQRIEEATTALGQGVNRLVEIRGGLDGLVDVSTDRPPSGVLIRVTFSRDTAIGNVVDLKDWSETWFEIARGVAMVHQRPPEDITVVGAGRGSLVIDLSVSALVIATTISSILMKSLQVAERVIDLRMRAEGLRTMQLRNDQIAGHLDEEAEQEKRAAVAEITSDVTRESGLDSSSRGDAVIALRRSVDLLLDFLEKGGEVDPILPPEGEEGAGKGDDAEAQSRREEMSQLRGNVREIRRLGDRVRMLEAGEWPPE